MNWIKHHIKKTVSSFFILACMSHAAVSAGTDARESHYSIFSRGFRVGEMKTVCSLVPSAGKKVFKFESSTHVNANIVFYSYALESKEKALVGDEGAFRYKRTSREKDASVQVEGRLENGKFQFDVSEKGVRRTVYFDRAKYDCTTMECPETSMKKPGDSMSLRLLDLENLEVVTRTYRYVKDEEVTVNGARITCKVIDFEDPHKKCRRWIRGDNLGVVLARQDGNSKSGSYSLRMTTLSAAPQS